MRLRVIDEKEIEMLEEPARDDGVFVKGKAMFLIYNNLTVRRSSPSESIKAPLKLGHEKLDNPIVEHLDRKKVIFLRWYLHDLFYLSRVVEKKLFLQYWIIGRLCQ